MFKLTVIPLVSQLSHDFLPFLTFQTVWYQLPIKPKINESYKLENHLKSSESKIFTYPTFNPCCMHILHVWYLHSFCQFTYSMILTVESRFASVMSAKISCGTSCKTSATTAWNCGWTSLMISSSTRTTSSGISTSTYKNNIFFLLNKQKMIHNYIWLCLVLSFFHQLELERYK